MESTNFDTGKTSSCWEKSREIELWVSIVSLVVYLCKKQGVINLLRCKLMFS